MQTRKELIWSPLAETDLDGVLKYLFEKWGKLAVEDFIELTEKTLLQLSTNPKLFPVIESKKKIRKCVLTKHNSIFYRENKFSIDVLRIFDTRQDPNKFKK